ncbi:MAG: hypothetical protein HYS23_09465 [Geobacter sp.]|nr:hypothetical protein [Geobacter sp.]
MKWNRMQYISLVFLLFAMLGFPIYSGATDVTLNPGFIAGTVKIGDFKVNSIYVSAAGGGYRSSKNVYGSSNYSLTVQGGDWNYDVYASTNLSGGGTNSTYMTFSNRSLTVPVGQTATNDYNYNVGIVRFKLNITGDPFSYFDADSSAQKATSPGQEKTYTSSYVNQYPATGYWDMPVVANQQISVAASVYVGAAYGGNNYYFNIGARDIAPGQIVEVPLDIQFTAPPPPPPYEYVPSPPTPGPVYHYGNVAGKILLNNVSPDDFLGHEIQNLQSISTNPGNYNVQFRVEDGPRRVDIRSYFKDKTQFSWPYIDGNSDNNLVSVEADTTKTLDFIRDAGILHGEVNFRGTVKNEDLYSYSFGAGGVSSVWDPVTKSYIYQPTYGGAASTTKTGSDNHSYRFYLTEGPWNLLGSFTLVKRTSTPYFKLSGIRFIDFNKYYDPSAAYRDPTLVESNPGNADHITPGEVTVLNREYCTGSAIFRFRVAGGGKMSSPKISARATHYNKNGKRDLYALQISSYSSAYMEDGPELEVFGPPADYQLYSISATTWDGTAIGYPAMNVTLDCAVTKTLDIPGPDISVTSPVTEMVTNARLTTVSGTAFSNVAINGVTVNGQNASFSPTGSTAIPNQVTFSYDLPLADGKNPITTTAVDALNAKATDDRFIYVDRWVPTVSISTPKNGDAFIFSNAAIPVEVQAGDLGYGFTLKVMLDGTVIYQGDGKGDDIVPASISYNGHVGPLSVGDHVLTAVVTDRAGNSSSNAVSIRSYSDQWPPTVKILSPADGAYLGNVPVPLEVQAADQGNGFEMLVFLDEGLINQATGTADLAVPVPVSYSSNVGPLAGGDHVIRAVAKDLADQTASASHTIHVDPWLPTVNITLPQDGGYFGNANVPVQIQGADQGYGYTLKVYLDGNIVYQADGAADMASPVSITFDNIIGPLAGGDHVIKAVATDLAGNQATATKTVHVDTWLPAAIITGINQGGFYASTDTAIPLDVNAADQGYGYKLEVYLDGNIVYQADGQGDTAAPAEVTFKTFLGPLALGNHTISAVVTDLAGNSTTSTVSITSYLAVGVVVKPEARNNADEGTSTIFIQLPAGLTSTASLSSADNREITSVPFQYPVDVKYSATDDKILLKFNRTPELMADEFYTVEGKFYPNPSNPSEWYYWKGSDTTKW